jgi:NAD(P)H-hydrate epimerase
MLDVHGQGFRVHGITIQVSFACVLQFIMAAMSAGNQRLYTAAQVRQLDAEAIQGHGVPAYELMKRAGAAVADAAVAAWPEARRWLVLCGGGNNGGDGYVVASEARRQGYEAVVVALSPVQRLAGEAAQAAADWVAAGGEIHDWPLDFADQSGLVIDALLGTGLDREVGGAYREAIERVNALGCPRVAVDIPSGLNADTGQIMGTAIRADLTVTFIGRKRGLYTCDGPDCAGQIGFSDLGVPTGVYDAVPEFGLLDDATLPATLLGRRPRNSHKGSFGHVLVVGGNLGMSGAVHLAGEAALRAGAGLVTVGTHPGHALWLNQSRPELMVCPVAAANELDSVLERATVIAAGPGLGQDAWAKDLVQRCITAPQAMVLDADGLNLLADKPVRRQQWVITPHPAEAARLLNVSTAEIQADRFTAASQLATQFDAVVVLKGCGTVVAAPNGDWSVCTAGNPGMATAGSGDVLTGVIAAMLAQGLDPWLAARAGVAGHAGAGDVCARHGERGVLATDIAACLPEILNAGLGHD